MHVFNDKFEFQQLNPDDPVQDEKLGKIKHDRHYTYEDQLTCSKECLPNYEEKVFVVQKISMKGFVYFHFTFQFSVCGSCARHISCCGSVSLACDDQG